jgi:hypothetical protein
VKSKDIPLLLVIGFISAVLSVLISNNFIATEEKRSQEVEVVQPIVVDFPEPDEAFFNKDSVNSTQLIKIGEGANQSPFNQGN